MFPFEEFPKIPRLKKGVVITEKLDGTNAQIALFEIESAEQLKQCLEDPYCLKVFDGAANGDSPLALYVGSRNRWLKPTKSEDNFSFAAWVLTNGEDLRTLGPGRHYGEWWGKGIGPRQYGIDGRKFSLFNTARWNSENPNRPVCCEVVPILAHDDADEAMAQLEEHGSVAAPGFNHPEGIVVYHLGSRQMYKKTFKGDGGKWQAPA